MFKGHVSFQYLLPKEQWIMGSPTWFPVSKRLTILRIKTM